ncbi:MAG: hypothetical protein J6I49_05020 [Bacteroidales bacterium]|nr:hypothetical protein [Bacteroidales bacterium]
MKRNIIVINRIGSPKLELYKNGILEPNDEFIYDGIYRVDAEKNEDGLVLNCCMGDARIKEWKITTSLSANHLTEEEFGQIGNILSTIYLANKKYNIKRLVMGCDSSINVVHIATKILDQYSNELGISIKKIALFPSYIMTNQIKQSIIL